MRKSISFPRVSAYAALLVLLTSATACAQSKYANPITYGGITTVEDFLLALVDLIFLIAVPFIVICIIYAGFLFVSAGDNESQIATARKV
jgi:membrane glycosyltransferase